MVKYSVEQVSPKAVQKHAEDLYRNGFFCCEAVMSAIRSDFNVDVPEEVIALSSGMAIGAGRSGCMCGALNGGIMALGLESMILTGAFTAAVGSFYSAVRRRTAPRIRRSITA